MKLPACFRLLLSAVLTTIALAAAPAADALEEPIRLDHPLDCFDEAVAIDARPGGGFVSAWVESLDEEALAEGLHLQTRAFAADATPVGPQVSFPQVEGLDLGAKGAAVAAFDPERYLVAWTEGDGEAYARVLRVDGTPVGEVIDLPTADSLAAEGTPAGEVLVLAASLLRLPEGPMVTLTRISREGERLFESTIARYITHPTPEFTTPAIAASADGLVLGYGELFEGLLSEPRPIFFRPGQSPLSVGAGALDLGLAPLPGGGAAAVWRGSGGPFGTGGHILRMMIPPEGDPGPMTLVDEEEWAGLSGPVVASTPEGRFAVAWAGVRTTQEELGLWVREFAADGTPLGPAYRVPQAESPWRPSILWTGSGWRLQWREGYPNIPPWIPVGGCRSSGIFTTTVAEGLLVDSEPLPLRDGRFEARVVWRDPYNQRFGTGTPLPLTDDTGTFWFFREGNRELMVKVLDGRALNDAFWVFYGSTTSVEFDLVVTDTMTGDTVVYTNPPFHLASRGDTNAFPQTVPVGGEAAVAALDGAWSLVAPAPSAPAPSAPAPSAPAATAAATSPAATPAPSPAALRFGQSLPALPILPLDRRAGPLSPAIPSFDCDDPAEPGLCLGTSYEVTVRWFDPFNGGSGEGWGVPLSDDSGYFWFFDEDNAELLVKILPGGPVNGYDWVFYGSLTNVAFEIRVYEWSSGFERLYRNPPREFRSVGDTLAFPPGAACPTPCPAGGEPVCGNDGLTYPNACIAQCSGRSVLHPGACTWEPPE